MANSERPVTSALEEAVYVVFGGPTKAGIALRVSTQAVQDILRKGVIGWRDLALKWEDVTAEAGCRIPAAELMALVRWEGGPGGSRYDRICRAGFTVAPSAIETQAAHASGAPAARSKQPIDLRAVSARRKKWGTRPSSRCYAKGAPAPARRTDSGAATRLRVVGSYVDGGC